MLLSSLECTCYVYVQVKLWEVPADGISGSLSSATATFGPMEVSCGGGEERGREGRGEKGKKQKGRGYRYLSTYVCTYMLWSFWMNPCSPSCPGIVLLQKRIESLLFHPAADNVRHAHTHFWKIGNTWTVR